MIKAYLDTCIVSGLAKGDLPIAERTALAKVLRLHKAQNIQLVTSSLVKDEIDKIPEEYRWQHETIYNLLANIPIASASWTDSGLALMGCGGGTREDPLYSELRAVLPGEIDAQHIFQAIKSGAGYFVTTDSRTILRFREMLQSKYGVKCVTPSRLVKALTEKQSEGRLSS
jgi:predicted nucleic acid-binding protein